jgi:hypothetical protein
MEDSETCGIVELFAQFISTFLYLIFWLIWLLIWK